jgi:hypothetical protein
MLSLRTECLLQVGNQVIYIFDPDRKPQQAVVDA